MIKEYIYYSPIKKTVLEFIVKFIDKHKYSPTYLEIAKGVKSVTSEKNITKARAARICKDLVDLGLLQKSNTQSHRKVIIDSAIIAKVDSIQLNKGYVKDEFCKTI